MNDETITAREAARRRTPLDGADAQALEGALAMTERELDDARASLAQVRRNLNTMIRVHDKTVRERDAERDAEREIREAMETLLREVERERDALKRHYDAAGPEHNLIALLDLYETRRDELEDERNATNAARAESEAALGMLREGWDAMVRERDAYREKAARPMSHAVMTLDRCDRCGWPMAADGCAPGRCIAPDLRRVREEVGR